MAEPASVNDVELDGDFEPDERLFHYTSSEGLYGILSSGCLWATHFKFLNDVNEFFAAKPSLLCFVEQEARAEVIHLIKNEGVEILPGNSLEDVSRYEAEIIVESMYAATLKLAAPFVFSSYISSPKSPAFRNGELLHWATYARNGGYALEISPHKLMRLTDLMLEKQGVSAISQRALYVDTEVPDKMKDDYAAIGKVAREMVKSRAKKNTLAGVNLEPLASPFMRAASIIKNPFFKGEGEARLVAMRYKRSAAQKVPPEIFVRHSGGNPVPFIKLFEGDLLSELCPIEAIIVGPHRDKMRRAEALSAVLEGKGLEHIKVIESDVPYIDG